MRKTVLTYGLWSGAIVLILWFTTQALLMTPDGKHDFSKGEFWGYTNMIISLSLIFFGVRQYRDKYLEGKINFGKALQVGFLIALVASLIYMIGWMVYYNFSEVARQYPAQYLEYMMQKWAESGMPADELARKSAEFQKNMEMMNNPIVMALFVMLEILPIGILVALISAFILKKK